MSLFKRNILQFIDFKGIKKSEFYRNTGITRSVLDKNTGLTEDNLAKFIATYPEVELEWLLTGEGEMLKTKNKENLTVLNSKEKGKEKMQKQKIQKTLPNKTLNEPEPLYSNRGLPLIPIDAMAGFGVGEIQVMDYQTSRYVVPEFEELHAEFMIRVKGSSMYPKYNSGDLLACKKLDLSSLFFQWNKVYVLDTVQGAIVKRVKKSSKDNCVKLISENPNYDPFDLPVAEIHSIALVIGVIRME